MARRRFFVDEFHNRRAEVSGDDAHHLTRVLRVECGQQYEVCDNNAAWVATVVEAHKARVVFELNEPIAAKQAITDVNQVIAKNIEKAARDAITSAASAIKVSAAS